MASPETDIIESPFNIDRSRNDRERSNFIKCGLRMKNVLMLTHIIILSGNNNSVNFLRSRRFFTEVLDKAFER